MRLFFLTLSLTALLLLAGNPSPTQAGSDSDLLGDADCSGQVNSADGLTVLGAHAGELMPCAHLADVQCDGDIDAIDVLQILRFDAGLSPVQADICGAVGESTTPPPSSEQLIAEALDAGDIDYETSLRYRALALYDHPDLPDEYRSPVVNYHAAMGIMQEVLEHEGELSQQILDDLAPFLARPADPISIFNNPPDTQLASPPAWTSQSAAGGALRIWVHSSVPNPPTATWVADATAVWNALEPAGGGNKIFRHPIPDTPGAAIANPDNAIDIYFAPVNTLDPRQSGCDVPQPPRECFLYWNGGFAGYAAPYVGNTSSAYIMISSTTPASYLKQRLAHELMHAGQHAYDSHEALWLGDTTANWGAWRVLQELGESRQPLFDLLDVFFMELDQSLLRDPGYLELPRYRAWLYFMFASMETDDGIVTRIWEEAAKNGVQNEKAVDAIFPFDEHFDDFSVWNWNDKPPLVKTYRDAKGDANFPGHLRLQPRGPGRVHTFMSSPLKDEIELGLDGLSANYIEYTFDDSVRTIVFDSKLFGQANMHVWALVKVGLTWKDPQDWTGERRKEFCRDDPTENVTELVLIFSYTSTTQSIVPSKPIVEGQAQGCIGWKGTITMTHTDILGGFSTTITNTADVTFRPYDNDGQDAVGNPTVQYPCQLGDGTDCLLYFPTGTIAWTFDDIWDFPPDLHCEDHKAGSYPAGNIVFYYDQILELYPDDQGRFHYYGHGLDPTLIHRDCGAQSDIAPAASWFEAPETENYHIFQFESVISGSYRFEIPFEGEVWDWQWNLRRIGPPPGP
jgi:hypothetical protein